ncbi:MAG: TlpA family protein disulfide reductase [Gemmatirosa sp.]|nr:TlpA family protein disulfide reductase [Gemmatirosa sp.]
MRRLLLTAALLVGIPMAARAQEVGLPLGTRPPAAAVQTLDGKPADLSQFVGTGPVFIEFWATWCPNCKELEPQLKAVAKKYAGKIRFVGVAVSVNQSPERVKAYVQKYAIPGTILFDKSGAATGAYDVPATSYIVVLDRTGKVVYTGQGGDQNLDAAVRKAL